MMIKIIQIMVLAGIIAGCTTIPTPEIGQSPFVYPNAGFVSENNSTVWADLKAVGITNHADYVQDASRALSSFAKLGLPTTRDEQALRTDPFLSATNMSFVTFETFDPAERVAKYYLIQFEKHGWKTVREGLILEETNGGGDWIRVYQKGSALVRIHIVGIWKLSQQEREERANGSFWPRQIIFNFIGIAPPEIMGTSYQNKTIPDPTNGCSLAAREPAES